MTSKRQLTVTIDSELLTEAKELARLRGLSLSSLIEQSLRNVMGQRTQSFASRWRGQFKPVERNDARYAALAKKYLQ